jgi:uncharacterized repeat protein (TIGR01451 family)
VLSLTAALLLHLGRAESAPAAAQPGPLRVYVLVLDGLRPSEVNPTLMPNLTALRAMGTWYEQARSVYIAETLPNHAAMMTGVLPERNGIVANDYWHPRIAGVQRAKMQDASLLEADTLTTRLERSCDISTASVLSKEYLWELFKGEQPNAADPHPQVEADYHWDPHSSPLYIGAPDDHAPDEATMNEGLLPWVRSAAAAPQFVFVNLGDIDRSGHVDETGALTEGGTSAFRDAAMRDTDAQLGLLLDELQTQGAWDDTVMIIASDHGFDWSQPQDNIFVAGVLGAHGYASGDELHTVPTPNGGAAMVYVKRQEDIAPIARILAAEPSVEVVATRESVPDLGNPTLHEMGLDNANAGDVVVFLRPGWRVADESNIFIPGNHGHPVTQHSTLLVTGGHPLLGDVPASIPGEPVYDPAVKPFSPPAGGPGNLSIAATVAALFGIGQPTGGYDGAPLNAAFEDYAFLPHQPCAAATPPPDLSVDTSDQPDPVRRNSNLTYTITVDNGGASEATGVTLTDQLPDTVRFRNVKSTQGSCATSSRTVRCALGQLALGTRATVTIEVRADRAGTIVNRATATANEPELNQDNNESLETTVVLPASG